MNTYRNAFPILAFLFSTVLTTQPSLGASENVPITFYGKVIDQNGQPVEGAKISLVVVISHIEQYDTEAKPVSLETGQNGDFTLTGYTAYAIDKISVEKKGYELSQKTLRSYVFGGGFDYKSNRNNPVIFKVWKKHGGEPLDNTGGDFRIPYDGTPIVYDLVTGKKVKDDGHSGDLRIRLVRDPLRIKRGRQKYDWKATIEAIDGGVIESINDDFMYLAPADGYQQKIEIEFKKDDPKWQSDKEIFLFLKSQDGKHYGRAKMEFRTDSERADTGFTLHSTLNPDASRNLEP